nr:phosphoribostamycin synthase [Niallia circulans]
MKHNPNSLFRELENFVRGSKDPVHPYMYACMLEQRLADWLLLSRCGVYSEDGERMRDRLISLRHLCVKSAGGIAEGGWEAHGDTPAWPEYGAPETFVLQRRPELLSLLKVMQELRTPECSGYDLCDLEVCREDALDWIVHTAPKSPPLVIGVRTGGAYYAPFWSSALRERWGDAPVYHTVRALRPASDPDVSLYVPEELELLPAEIDPDTDIVLVEDQPHTGGTVLELARRLRIKYNPDTPVWVASPGRLFRAEQDRLVPVTDRIPLAATRQKRVWQMLGSSDELIQAFQPALELTGSRTADLEAVTYKSEPHWNAPVYRSKSPFRINPKKSPFIIRRKDTNAPVAFAKFIGKDLFGDFQVHQLKKFEPYIPEILAYRDGYVLTAYEPGLKTMRDMFVNVPLAVSSDLVDSISGYWITLLRTCRVSAGHPVHPLADQWEAHLGELEGFTGRMPVYDKDWFQRSLHAVRSSSPHVYTSLPYASGHTHWKAGLTRDRRMKTYRFHMDSTWGGTSAIEVELASFLLENRVRPADARLLINRVRQETDALTVQSVTDALPVACMLQAANLLKQAKGEAGTSKEQILAETIQSFDYLQAMKPKLSDVT